MKHLRPTMVQIASDNCTKKLRTLTQAKHKNIIQSHFTPSNQHTDSPYSAQVGYTVPFTSVHAGEYGSEDKSKADITHTKTKHNPKHSKTKLTWFSRLLRHSARKRGGLILRCFRAHTGPMCPQLYCTFLFVNVMILSLTFIFAPFAIVIFKVLFVHTQNNNAMYLYQD